MTSRERTAILVESVVAGLAFVCLLALMDWLLGGRDVTTPGYFVGLAVTAVIFTIGWAFLTVRYRDREK